MDGNIVVGAFFVLLALLVSYVIYCAFFLNVDLDAIEYDYYQFLVVPKNITKLTVRKSGSFCAYDVSIPWYIPTSYRLGYCFKTDDKKPMWDTTKVAYFEDYEKVIEAITEKYDINVVVKISM